MIPIPRDYDSARAFDGAGGPTLTPGGHICRIQGVRVDKSRSGKDMLVVAFDIAEGGELDGYYRARYERASAYSRDAKWPGVFRCTLLNAEGKTNGFFKGFIEAVEESNPNYSFRATNGDERALKDKLVGFNFGEEEYEYADRKTGEIKVGVNCKPQHAASVARVREGLIPPAKKQLNNPSAAPSGVRPVGQPDAQGFQEVTDDEMPF